MQHKKKKVDNKFYYILFIFLIFIMGVIIFNKQNIKQTYFFKNTKNILEKSKKIVFTPFTNITNQISNFGKYNNIIKENSLLIKQNQELQLEKEKYLLLEKEINELKKILSLNDLYVDYELVTATVSSRNVDYWFNNITIDKGENDGIEIGNASVTANGLIGKVIATTKDTATIKLITNKDASNKISVSVEGKDGYHQGSIIDYQDNFLIVEGINNYDNVSIDSKVLTSGFGSFPSNLFIGYVKKINEDNYGMSKILYVKPSQDMNNLYYITVLKDKK